MLLAGNRAGDITDCGDIAAREAFLPWMGARGCHEDLRAHWRDSVTTHREDQSNGCSTACFHKVGTE